MLMSNGLIGLESYKVLIFLILECCGSMMRRHEMVKC